MSKHVIELELIHTLLYKQNIIKNKVFLVSTTLLCNKSRWKSASTVLMLSLSWNEKQDLKLHVFDMMSYDIQK